MKIILTSDLRKCPYIEGVSVVNADTIKNYEGNPEVEALICSRDVAQTCQHMNLPNLKMIQLFSAGYDGIDPKLLKSKGVTLCNAANVYNVGMSEFVVYSMLMSAKRYNKGIKNRLIRPFRKYRYISELAGKTVGILGAGNIGGQIARRLEAFDMNVIGYDIVDTPRQYFSKIYTPDTIKDFLQQSDYIVNCMPLVKATESLIDKQWFDNMKKNVTIVNVGRKQIFNNHDFLTFLRSNKDAIAVLDMFEKFPNPFTNPFRRLSNVIVLPGVTAISQEINQKLKVLIQENLYRLKNGEEFINKIL